MAIVSFTFNKFDVERKKPLKGKVSINNNVAVKDAKAANLSIGKSTTKALQFSYEFSAKYEPDIGHILITGDITYLTEEKKIKEIVDGWKKDKKLPDDVMNEVINQILNKCNIEALILSKELNLPPPIPMPKITPKKE